MNQELFYDYTLIASYSFVMGVFIFIIFSLICIGATL